MMGVGMLWGLLAVLVVAIAATTWSLTRRRARRRNTVETAPAEFVFSGAVHTGAVHTGATPAGRAAAASALAPTSAPAPVTPGATVPTKVAEPPPEVKALDSDTVFVKLHELALGVTGLGAAPTADHEAVAAATTGALQDGATQDRYAPRRPSLLPQLLRAVNDEDVSRRELVSIIARDPSLVGNLLKMANSPFYRVSPHPVESIDRAVVMLGNDGIRSLIAASLTQPIFQVPGGDFPRFPEIAWEHTFRAASATVTHAAIVEKSDPFAAQLLGLVSGLAGIVVFRVVLDQYEAHPKLRPDAGVIASLLDTQSAGVAKQIAASWGLSDRILAALDDQTTAVAPDRHTALGRSLSFGRLAGALAVLSVNGTIDDVTAQVSMPVAGMPAVELGRLWTRLTAQQQDGPKKKKAASAR